MIDYLFPIFGLGVAVSGIVVKGLILAKDMAAAQTASEVQPNAETERSSSQPFRSPFRSRATPIGNDRVESRSY